MIIFGTRGITTTPEKGEFNCPTCSQVRAYGLKRVRNCFTLYFIPVIPLNKLGEYVECSHCKDTYKADILSYDPAANSEACEAEYHLAIKKVMLHVLLADGVVDDSEIESVQDIYQKLTGSPLYKNNLLLDIEYIQNNNEDLSQELIALQGRLNDEGKEMVITAAFHIAMADGEFQQEEQQLLAQIGSDLGMTAAHIQGVIASVQTA